MTRPASLNPLFAGLETLEGIGPKAAKVLPSLGVALPKDFLFLMPHSGIDRTRRTSVRDVVPPCILTVEITVIAHQPNAQKGKPYRVIVRDEKLDFALVFFHARRDYLEKILPIGERRLISGKIELFDGVAQMVHPDHILDLTETLAPFEPVYPLVAGITQRQVQKAVTGALARLPQVPEWIDGPLLAREGWPDWTDALTAAHAPQSALDLRPEAKARERLAYDELFAHQLTLSLARALVRRGKGRQTAGTGALSDKALKSLPYQPTGAQTRAVREIAQDMESPLRMNRLLQGDVGSGKTLVAFLALVIAVEAGGQGVLMAPTEILARQHLEGLAPLAEAAGIRLTLLTGRDKGRERRAKLESLASGDIGILVGTHAVFQKDVEFADLRLAVIDEQHRFGVSQRMELGAKGASADVLVMTATPIPRSLALASYGDMDVSVLDEKPPGRKPIKTVMISDNRLDEVVARLARAMEEGRQAYWVCPLVEDSEVLDYASAEARFQMLRAALGDCVGLVHGQMPPAEKDAAMARFVAGETRLLVATTVIEVGVNVPGASIMVIERAEIFGLAQLHQLRGRVGRGAAESTCLLMYQAPLQGSSERRLSVIRDTEDGFRIAEEDMAMRGAGDLIGTAQSGLPRFRVADLERQAGLMAVAQTDARRLLGDDPGLTSPRGQAARVLLWLLDQDRAIRLLTVG
ncbi:ATP-dependent DNA helicase RecG [Rhodobacter sp. KR11]|uniref:ATP-dependent DNA helicase RecG n=1 Tax=Rhodobacter sp. KR11 TaxID=2974588 RepID=UPI00222319E1|nr:ATP-dependent DNA helicase RecG [Rhodobacter sp. KR11]MCW1919587.1 ATP-dependent DNA helicase RecG [Rhodobacter sp. KR11]